MTIRTILYADDDADMRDLVRLTLEKASMNVILARNGHEAMDLWRKHPVDLLILDIRMPGMDGLELCRYIRRLSDVPMLMLTALDDEATVVEGFEAGADDYIVKPYRPRELLARIQAIFQRTERAAGSGGNRLYFEDFVLDRLAQRVARGELPIETSPLEFRLLEYLMQRPEMVVSKEELFQQVWGYAASAGGTNLIEVAVRRLREKIEDDPSQPRFLVTTWGKGYRFGA